MVIVHVVAPAEVGGLERVVTMLAGGMRGLGNDVHVTAVVGDPGAARTFLAPLEAAGVGTRTLVVGDRAYRAERAAIAQLCRELRPDVVHTHGYRPDLVDASVARRLGVSVVTTVHGFTGGGWRDRAYEWLQCRAFRRFDAVIAVSRPLVARLQSAGVPASRLHEVRNAWSPAAPLLDRDAARRALGLPREGFAIGWLGRLSREKGPDVFVAALPYLEDLPLTASIVGDGAMRRSLQAQADTLRLNGRIRWHGLVPDGARVLPAFDVCVLSSRTEGTPMVLFEAMAAEVPIVATTVGGVPDVVSPREAVLVPSDDPVALAATIRDIYRHAGPAQERARAARARLEREFAVAPWLARYEAIYRQVARQVAA
jgi:glycosyltransferase involved in cell wall biosynthesis